MSEHAENIQEILDAVTGALVRGNQDGSPPSSRDHWLYPFWEMGNAERKKQDCLVQLCRELDAVIDQRNAECDRLVNEVEQLRSLLAECSEYLNASLNSISHGSILHRKMMEALNDRDDRG